jgi:hypothetical protein
MAVERGVCGVAGGGDTLLVEHRVRVVAGAVGVKKEERSNKVRDI